MALPGLFVNTTELQYNSAFVCYTGTHIGYDRANRLDQFPYVSRDSGVDVQNAPQFDYRYGIESNVIRCGNNYIVYKKDNDNNHLYFRQKKNADNQYPLYMLGFEDSDPLIERSLELPEDFTLDKALPLILGTLHTVIAITMLSSTAIATLLYKNDRSQIHWEYFNNDGNYIGHFCTTADIIQILQGGNISQNKYIMVNLTIGNGQRSDAVSVFYKADRVWNMKLELAAFREPWGGSNIVYCPTNDPNPYIVGVNPCNDYLTHGTNAAPGYIFPKDLSGNNIFARYILYCFRSVFLYINEDTDGKIYLWFIRTGTFTANLYINTSPNIQYTESRIDAATGTGASNKIRIAEVPSLPVRHFNTQLMSLCEFSDGTHIKVRIRNNTDNLYNHDYDIDVQLRSYFSEHLAVYLYPPGRKAENFTSYSERNPRTFYLRLRFDTDLDLGNVVNYVCSYIIINDFIHIRILHSIYYVPTLSYTSHLITVTTSLMIISVNPNVPFIILVHSSLYMIRYTSLL